MPSNITDGIVEQLEVEGETYIEDWMQTIKDRLSQAESLEDFRNQLDSLIPELNFAEYGEVNGLAKYYSIFSRSPICCGRKINEQVYISRAISLL